MSSHYTGLFWLPHKDEVIWLVLGSAIFSRLEQRAHVFHDIKPDILRMVGQSVGSLFQTRRLALNRPFQPARVNNVMRVSWCIKKNGRPVAHIPSASNMCGSARQSSAANTPASSIPPGFSHLIHLFAMVVISLRDSSNSDSMATIAPNETVGWYSSMLTCWKEPDGTC